MIYSQIQKYVYDAGEIENYDNFCLIDNSTISYWGYSAIPIPLEEDLLDVSTASAWYEDLRQNEKDIVLKVVEDRFIYLCDYLTQSNSHTRLGFDTLNTIVQSITTIDRYEIAMRLLAIDAEGKREGGRKWWDDCIWHPEVSAYI